MKVTVTNAQRGIYTKSATYDLSQAEQAWAAGFAAVASRRRGGESMHDYAEDMLLKLTAYQGAAEVIETLYRFEREVQEATKRKEAAELLGLNTATYNAQLQVAESWRDNAQAAVENAFSNLPGITVVDND